MNNNQIAESFSLLAKLMQIHNENSFKAKSYASAAFTIDKLTIQLSETPLEKIVGIKGMGESSGKKVIELLTTGVLQALEEMIAKTPPGVIEMLNIKGIGPKKICTIWKEMEIARTKKERTEGKYQSIDYNEVKKLERINLNDI